MRGTIERFDTRFKTRASILERLERFRADDSPHYRLQKFNDALRYTITVGASDYWGGVAEIQRLFTAEGFRVVRAPTGWR